MTREGPLQTVGWLLVNTVQAIAVAVWTAVLAVVAIALMLLTWSRDSSMVVARRIWSPGLLWIGGVRLEIQGGDQIDWSKPHIFAMNHQSAVDIPVGFIALRCNLRFVAKKTLAYVPFLGWYMAVARFIFVDRSSRVAAIASLKKAGERIRDGSSILAFPEGTRTRDGSIRPFKKGVFVVALEARVPIVPVAIEGAARVLPADGFKVRPGVIKVAIGAPISTTEYTVEQRGVLVHKVRDAIIDLNVRLGGPGGDKQDAIAEQRSRPGPEEATATAS